MMTRFTAGVLLLGCAGCAAYPFGLLLAATPADFALLSSAFGPIPYTTITWYPQPVTGLQVQHLGELLGVVAMVLTGSGIGLLWVDWPHHSQLGREWARVRGRGRLAWTGLAEWQQRGVVLGFAGLVALRLLLSVWLAPEDDAYSYRLFVRHSLLLISSCYPIPNNHVLTNSISHFFYLVKPSFWWSMRLPVLLVSAVGTLGWFGLVVVRTNFRVAVLAVGVFCCLQLSLFNAAQGRGYWLLLALSAVGFDSVLALTVPAGRQSRQLPWLALGVLGPLGLYAIPTFAYFLFSAYTWLIGYWVVRRAWRPLAQVGLLLGGTLLATALLYAPVLLVSSFAALVHNPYVTPAADAAAYWRSLPAELWVMEGRLTAEKHVGGVLALAVLVGAVWLVRRQWRAVSHRLTVALVLPLLALWFVLSPYLLMAAQRVRAPERTLLYKSQFFFLLAALVAEPLLARRRAGGPWWQKHWPLLLLVAWLLLQLTLLYRMNESIKAYGKSQDLGVITSRNAIFPTISQ